MAKFLLVDFRPRISKTIPIKTITGRKNTIFKKGEGAIGFILKRNKNIGGNKPIIKLIIPHISEIIAFPLELDLI